MTEYRDPAEVGMALAALRQRERCSQTDVAGVLGVDASAVSRIESGKRSLSAVEAVKAARYFDVPVERILMRQEPMAVLLRAGDSDRPEIEAACQLVRSVVDDLAGFSSLMAR